MDRLTSDEVADRLVKDKAKFIKHHNVWLAEKENWKQMQASYLKDKHTIVIGRDFSAKLLPGSMLLSLHGCANVFCVPCSEVCAVTRSR